MQSALIGGSAGLFVIVQVGAVDVLGNVFGDIARGITLGRVYLFPVKAGSKVGKGWGALDIPYQLVMVIGQGIALQDTDHPVAIFRAHKWQQVPVRGAVMVSLAHAKSINGSVPPLEGGHWMFHQTMTYAHFAPDYLNDAVRFNPLENHLQPA